VASVANVGAALWLELPNLADTMPVEWDESLRRCVTGVLR